MSDLSQDPPVYQRGFGNEFESEAVPGALPKGQNNPLPVPLGLYTEQLSGTAFTKPRVQNFRSWLYRIQPSVSGYDNGKKQGAPYSPFKTDGKQTWFGHFNCEKESLQIDPNPKRWKPMPAIQDEKVTFIDGVRTMCASGSVEGKSGLSMHVYAFNDNMTSRKLSMYSSDGDFLIVPQAKDLKIQTEMGILHVNVGEICVLPRGIVFSVDALPTESNLSSSKDDFARGYILEIYKGRFEIPDLGPIGSNGLANPRDFEYPVAHYDKDQTGTKEYIVVNKFCNKLFCRTQNHSPFNVVAWHGNYSPFKYDLSKFCCINSVTYDHPDPSIYTVLTAKSDDPGTALADFVIFPPRWMVMEHSFRPPWFHRNCMAEFMGMIYGSYDAKAADEFGPGCASLHNVMTPHGPDAATVVKENHRGADEDTINKPHKFSGGLAFMFETSLTMKLTPFAAESSHLDANYTECWKGIPAIFKEE
jgi:homogentisate 1,2-dioxygenase